jgi:hypothetical protein
MLVPISQDQNNTDTGWFVDTATGKVGYYVAGTKRLEFSADGSQISTFPALVADLNITGQLVADKLTATGVIVGENVHIGTDKISCTNAQLKALRAAPKQLAAAPGAGKIVQFLGALLKLNAGANVLSETADNLGVKYENGSGVQVSEDIECTGFIDQAASTWTSAVPKKNAIVADSACVNKALVLHNIGDGEFADNAANDATLDIYVSYAIVTV